MIMQWPCVFLSFLYISTNRFLHEYRWKIWEQLLHCNWCRCLVLYFSGQNWWKIVLQRESEKLPYGPSSYINSFFFIFKWFHPYHNTLFHRGNHKIWYLIMITIWCWCGSMHGCFCLHPFKVLVFLFIQICHHLLWIYWIKFPLFQLSGFWLPTLYCYLWCVHCQVTYRETQ